MNWGYEGGVCIEDMKEGGVLGIRRREVYWGYEGGACIDMKEGCVLGI